MKKSSILSLFLVLVLLMSQLSSCQTIKEKTAQIKDKANEVKEQISDVKDTVNTVKNILDNPMDTITDMNESGTSLNMSPVDELTMAYRVGDMEETEYHVNVLSTALSNEDDAISSSFIYDISPSIQWMVDHYEDLSADDQAQINQLVPPIFSPISDNTGSLDMRDYFQLSLDVHAEEDIDIPMALYPRSIDDKVYINHMEPTLEIKEELEDLIISTYDEIKPTIGDPLEITQLPYNISFDVMLLPPTVISYSSLRTEWQETDLVPVFHIALSSTASNDEIQAAMVHELFHAYQMSIGYKRANSLENFLMESTAIWMVTYVYPDNPIPDRTYADTLYVTNFNLNTDSMNDYVMKSWYQLPYFIERAQLDTKFVKDYLETGVGMLDLGEVFVGMKMDLTEIARLFNLFVQALVMRVDPSPGSYMGEPPYESRSIIVDDLTTMTVAEIAEKEPEDDMSHYTIDNTGIDFIYAPLDLAGQALIDLYDNLSGEVEDEGHGLIVFGVTDDDFERLLSTQEGLYTKIFSTSDKNYKGLLFAFFNIDFVSVTHDYRMDVQQEITGTSMINVEINRTFPASSDNGYEHREDEYKITLEEELSLMIATADDSVYGDMLNLSTGDPYFVENLYCTFSGKSRSDYTNGNWNVYEYDGGYVYDSLADTNTYSSNPGGDANLDLGQFFSGLQDGLPGTDSNNDGSDSLQPSQGGGLGAISGLLDQFNDLVTSNPDLPGLPEPQEINTSTDENGVPLPDFDPSLLTGLLGNVNKVIRMREDLNLGTFTLYPTLPKDLERDDWVVAKSEVHRKNADGQMETFHDTSDTTPVISFFPLWFTNTAYDPDGAEEYMDSIPEDEEDYAEEYQDMESIRARLQSITGDFDKNNLAHMVNMGPQDVDVNTLHSDLHGSMTQELSEANGVITGDIKGNYTDSIGADYYVHIHIEIKMND